MTNEELLQLKQLLDAQKQEIVAQMDQRLAQQKQEIVAQMDQKLAQQKQEIIRQCTANMNVLIESMIQPQINLLIERMDSIESKMATQKDLDEFELAIDERFDILEALVTRHGHEITRLKKAQ